MNTLPMRTKLAFGVGAIGAKPISDGADTDANGIHYITNLSDNGIDILDNGELKPLIRNPKLDWPDAIRISNDGYGYIVVNQLHKAAAITGQKEAGTPPYYIFRVKVDD